MNNNLLLLLLLGHVLGDFYFQNDGLAKGKQEDLSQLFLHGGIYFLTSIFLVVPLGQLQALLVVGIVTLGHLVIDFIKYRVGKRIQSNHYTKIDRQLKQWDEQGVIYLVDQLIHLAFMLGVVTIYSRTNVSPIYWNLPFGKWLIRNDVLGYVLAILVILKPTNITFRALFSQNKPADEVTFVKDLKTGKRIGNMERLLILAFLAMNQYTAIGLVFTAKSFTRYKRIIEDTAFAEYYLLGTLFSILATLGVYMLIFVIK